MLRADVEQTRFTADVRLQGHNDALAQRVDRWVSYLGKLLAKIIEK